MARYKNGVNGTFSGKVGDVVGVTWRGIDLMRSLPESGKDAPSDKQLDQRFLFGLVNSWMKPIRDLIWVGFQIFTGTKTPMNGAVSLLFKEAVLGSNRYNYAIDFARVVLSRGELLASFVTEIFVSVNSMVNIKWENFAASAFCNDDDMATFIVYNPQKGEFVTFRGATPRSATEVSLQLPESFDGDAIHAWMYYVNAAGNAVSTSTYLGEVLVAI